jgi:hypothetical protein
MLGGVYYIARTIVNFKLPGLTLVFSMAKCCLFHKPLHIVSITVSV